MLLVLIVGCGIGWKVSRDRSEQQAVEAIRAAGGTVLYDYQYSTDLEIMIRIMSVKEPTAPRWLRRWLGDDFFRSVAAVQFMGPIQPEVLGAVARLDGLVYLNLPATQGLEDAWPVLGRLTRLEKVYLAGSGVNDQAIQTFGKLGSLWWIHLSNARLSDKALDELARFPALRDLTFGACRGLTDDRLARFLSKGPTNLESFRLFLADNSLPLTVATLAKHHRGLRQLSFSQTPVADADLAPLEALTSLTRLSLQQTEVTDAGIAHLTPLRNLEFLSINLPGITDRGMKSISPLQNLHVLDLSYSHLGDAGLAELAGLRRLELLMLMETEVSDGGITRLGSLSTLKYLTLNGTKVTAAGVAALRAALPKLAISTKSVAKTPGPSPTPPH